MPVERCEEDGKDGKDGKPGFRWGQKGKCYTYEPGNARSRAEARLKAELQGRAIEANKRRANENAR